VPPGFSCGPIQAELHVIISDCKEWMYLGLAWRNFQTGVIVQLESTINILRQI
jgi:hypothetical protein